MPKWETKIVERLSEDYLNKLGQERWKVVSVWTENKYSSKLQPDTVRCALLQREVEEASPITSVHPNAYRERVEAAVPGAWVNKDFPPGRLPDFFSFAFLCDECKKNRVGHEGTYKRIEKADFIQHFDDTFGTKCRCDDCCRPVNFDGKP